MFTKKCKTIQKTEIPQFLSNVRHLKWSENTEDPKIV